MERKVNFRKILNNLETRNCLSGKIRKKNARIELIAVRDRVTELLMEGIPGLPYVKDKTRKRELVEKRAVVNQVLRKHFNIEMLYVAKFAFGNDDHSFSHYLENNVFNLVSDKVVEEVSNTTIDIVIENAKKMFKINEYGLVILIVDVKEIEKVSWTEKEIGSYLYELLK